MSKFHLISDSLCDPEEVLSRGLPKWPQMRVKGDDVSTEQALEIIRRTDLFFEHESGNNVGWKKWATKMLKIPRYDDYEDYHAFQAEKDEFDKTWGLVTGLEYVNNSWLSSNFIGGPHGWCSPQGKIYFSDNVGKWPSSNEIFDEWKIIAREFPFLKCGIVLMDGESLTEGTKPVCGFIVRNGLVNVVDPLKVNPLFEFEKNEKFESNDLFEKNKILMRFVDPTAEQGVDNYHIIGWAKRFWGEDHIHSVTQKHLES